MEFRAGSQWSEQNEIRSFIIFKQLQLEGFPYGRQAELCREMAAVTNLDWSNISAKVTNYKSLAGLVRPNHASRNSAAIYERYRDYSVGQLRALLV